MMTFLHGVARAVAESFDLPGPVLEIGSYQVSGQEEIGNLRPLFGGRAYVGIDARPGPGVDRVADAEALPFATGSVGTVIAMNTFEHVRQFWKAFSEAERVLRPDGALLVSCPFYFRIHHHPSDYWRFTPEALDLLLENYPSRILGWHGPPKRPINVWAVGFRHARPAVTRAAFDRYRTLLGEYGRQPIRPLRALRYRAGALLFGRRPFGPYLERDRWETELHAAGAAAGAREAS